MKYRALNLIVGAVAAALSSQAMATTIYAENFSEPAVAGNLRFGTAGSTVIGGSTYNYTNGNGWMLECPNTQTAAGPFGVPLTSAQYAAGPSGAIQYDSNTAGNEIPAVNSGTPDGGANASYGRVWFSGFGTNGILWTSEYQVDLNTTTLNTVSWYARTDGVPVAGTARVALEIGSNWYVSDRTPGTNAWAKETVSVASTNWYPLNYVQGVSLDQTIGTTPVTLPTTGTVTAFGVYFDNTSPTGIDRIDSYAIDATVPEPACMALLGLSGLGILRRRR